MKHTDINLVLLEIYLRPVLLQSDFARTHDQTIAALACDGLITTYEYDGTYGRTWRVTTKGLYLIEKFYYETSDENPHLW